LGEAVQLGAARFLMRLCLSCLDQPDAGLDMLSSPPVHRHDIESMAIFLLQQLNSWTELQTQSSERP